MLPSIHDNRVNFEVGLFQDTLTDFIKRTRLDRRLVIHLDADLYSSMLFVLTPLAASMKEGDIVIFDDFFITYVDHEVRALLDFISA